MMLRRKSKSKSKSESESESESAYEAPKIEISYERGSLLALHGTDLCDGTRVHGRIRQRGLEGQGSDPSLDARRYQVIVWHTDPRGDRMDGGKETTVTTIEYEESTEDAAIARTRQTVLKLDEAARAKLRGEAL